MAMLKSYEMITQTGKRSCQDLVSAFRPHTVMAWLRPILTQYIDFIVSRGVYIDEGPNSNRHEAVIEILLR